MLENFLAETKLLLDDIDPESWKGAAGVSAEYFPWHRQFWIAIRLDGEDPEDPAMWKYYEASRSECSNIQQEFAEYHQAVKARREQPDLKLEDPQDVVSRHLTELAEILLTLDYSNYTDRLPVLSDGTLNPNFLLQVSHSR